MLHDHVLKLYIAAIVLSWMGLFGAKSMKRTVVVGNAPPNCLYIYCLDMQLYAASHESN